MSDSVEITSGEVAPLPTRDSVTAALAERFMTGEAVAVSDDPGAVAREIVGRILSAPDEAAVLEDQDLTHARDILGVPLVVQSVRWSQSDFPAGDEGGAAVSFYAVIDSTRMDTGEAVTWSCGGLNVLAQLFRLVELGKIPGARVRVVESRKPTKEGYRPLWLSGVRVDESGRPF